MANYKYENGKYYRQSSDNTWFEVTLGDNGKFTWVLPDGKRVYDPNYTWHHVFSPSGINSPRAIVHTGYGGMTYVDPKYLKIAQAEANRFTPSDPSENILNDVIFSTFTGIPKAIYTGGKALVNGGINLTKSIIEKSAKETAKKVATKATEVVVRELPRVGASIGTGTIVDGISNLLTGKTWGENVSNVLSNRYGFEVPTIVGDFTNPGYYAGYNLMDRAIRGARPIYLRYKLAHTPVSTTKKNTDYIKRKMPHKTNISDDSYSMSENVGKLTENDDGTYNATGGFIVKPGKTVETHFNPSMQVRFKNSTDYTVLNHTAPGFQAKKDFVKFWEDAPEGMVISSTNEALNAAQIIPKFSWYDRYLYYLFGRNPIKKPVLVDGYSTSIVEQFQQLANKRKGIVAPSLTTRITGINKFGTNFAEFKPYFTRILDNGDVLFADMTHKMVTKWNREIAPKYGIHIDPKTRTAQLLTLIKTE